VTYGPFPARPPLPHRAPTNSREGNSEKQNPRPDAVAIRFRPSSTGPGAGGLCPTPTMDALCRCGFGAGLAWSTAGRIGPGSSASRFYDGEPKPARSQPPFWRGRRRLEIAVRTGRGDVAPVGHPPRCHRTRHRRRPALDGFPAAAPPARIARPAGLGPPFSGAGRSGSVVIRPFLLPDQRIFRGLQYLRDCSVRRRRSTDERNRANFPG